MYVVLAWFSDRSLPFEVTVRARVRLDAAVSSLVPDSYVRHDFGADDWGLTILHPPDAPAWRWQVFAEDRGVRAVSMGVPVGLDVTAGPVALARRLLRGEDVHAHVVPPFGLIAFEGERRFALQQDWLGMCRIFTRQSDGLTVFSSRPSLVAEFLGEAVIPDYDGWASYAICGHFGGDMSPIRGVRLLGPGARVTGHRRDGGGWDLALEIRYAVDDVISAGIAARNRGVGEALDMAADGLSATAASIDDLYDDPVTLGLSGGKDSRLIAASFIAGGRLPRFNTNDDMAAEGETARALVEILREKRGLEPEHRLVRAGTQAVVVNMGLHERVRRLQRLHDYQYPSSFTVRWPGLDRLPATARPMSLTGVGGEVAVGSWYPKVADVDDYDKATAVKAVLARLLSAVHGSVIADSVAAQERDRLVDLLDHAETVGLRGLELADYTFLTEHIRRRASSAYFVGMVTPFLAPTFVTAAFALSPEQKRNRVLHTGLLRRFVPEWADVPFVRATSGPSTAARIWDGDGLAAIHGLLDTTYGDLSRLVRRDAVAATVARCVRGEGTVRSQRTLQQFAWLAVASQSLEPAGVRLPSQTYADFVEVSCRPLVPAPVSSMAARLRFLKKSRLGRRIWAATRTRVVQQRRRRMAAADVVVRGSVGDESSPTAPPSVSRAPN